MKQVKADIYVAKECDLTKFGFSLDTSLSDRELYRYDVERSGIYVDASTRKLTWLSLSMPLVIKIIELAQHGFITVVRADEKNARPIVARLTLDEWREVELKRAKDATN